MEGKTYYKDKSTGLWVCGRCGLMEYDPHAGAEYDEGV